MHVPVHLPTIYDRIYSHLGYSTSEARLGLRACGGDVDRTISYIIDLRSSRDEARKRSRKERRVMKTVGKSKDDTWVNPRSLTDLVDMGFRSELCVVALQLSENNVAEAVIETIIIVI